MERRGAASGEADLLGIPLIVSLSLSPTSPKGSGGHRLGLQQEGPRLDTVALAAERVEFSGGKAEWRRSRRGQSRGQVERKL